MQEKNESNAKRSKSDENENKAAKEEQKAAVEENKDNQKPPEPPKDYIHVRARRGQATDAHSLAERVCPFEFSKNIIFFKDLIRM